MTNKRYLIECTYVFDHPEDNSGIQRVVRNIIRNLQNSREGKDCIPVAFIGGDIYQVKSLAPITIEKGERESLATKINRLRVRLELFHHRYWLWHSRLERVWPFKQYRNAKRILFIFARIAAITYRTPQKLIGISKPAELYKHRVAPIQVNKNDCLVLLDSSWHANFFDIAERLKHQGIDIVSVIYDLIPLTNPEFCDEGLVKVFESWFDWISNTADGFVCISETIMTQLREHIEQRATKEVSESKWYRYFHLGSDLDLIQNNESIDPEICDAYCGNTPTYLMVSTIEPRKNHKYCLDTFEILWANGVNIKLVFIGKIGWKVHDLIKRICKHPEFNRRLFMFNNASDADLHFAYQQSKCLLFPSFVEGFGLPIVEAMQRNIPVMVSDIPVFREIGGPKTAYFDLNSPKSLVALITQYETTNLFPSEAGDIGWHWLTWEQSTDQFLERVKSGLLEAH